jgi:hypothetical protein
MKQVVVCRHDETLDRFVAALPDGWDVSVVNKGAGVALPERIASAHVEDVANVGREAGAWCGALRRAIGLPAISALACVHADVEDHLVSTLRGPVDPIGWEPGRGLAAHLAAFDAISHAYMPLGPLCRCDRLGKPDHPGLMLDGAWRFVFSEKMPDVVTFHPWAMFVASRTALARVCTDELARMRIVASEWVLGAWLCERLWPRLFGATESDMLGALSAAAAQMKGATS